MSPYFTSDENDFALYNGDCREVVSKLGGSFDMIFADPPYFLSNGGISVHAGKAVCVNKGEWDKSNGHAEDSAFNYEWLEICRAKLTDAGTIWVCGTFHNIFSVANALTELGYRILNAVTWQKTNPPPNLSCRFFKHSTEIVVWARKSKKVPHYFNYDLMHKIAGGRQMTDVWRMPAIAPWEKTCGKHPTQKPLALVVRAILASTREYARILDPFTGSSTTGIAASLLGRSFVGVDSEKTYLDMLVKRHGLLSAMRQEWRSKIPDLRDE
jgi:site-specific DNA-methyltransferase (adenine-specific)